MAMNGMCAMLHDLNLPPHFWAEVVMIFMSLRNRMPMRANDGITPYEWFYWMKLDMGHICTFQCIMCVMLPSEELGKLEDRRAMRYLKGYKYKVNYHIWIPRIGVKEVKFITFFEVTVPALPNHGSITKVQHGPSCGTNSYRRR